jgi:hypothetical protein
VSGEVGSLLARKLIARGDDVAGLVRRPEQREALATIGVDGKVGDLATISANELAELDHPPPSCSHERARQGNGRARPRRDHGEIKRADLAETLAELIYEPRISQQVLELNTGTTLIHDAVLANIRDR